MCDIRKRIHLANISGGVERVPDAGALVGERFADELLPHVVDAGSAHNAANPAERV